MKRPALVGLAAVGFIGLAVFTLQASGPARSERAAETEREVSLDAIPAAVRATILREAGQHKVMEVEETTTGGRIFYEADWIVDGREFEVRVSPDGKLLEKGFDSEMDDEDDADGVEDDGDKGDDY